jgi:hypothetical protein
MIPFVRSTLYIGEEIFIAVHVHRHFHTDGTAWNCCVHSINYFWPIRNGYVHFIWFVESVDDTWVPILLSRSWWFYVSPTHALYHSKEVLSTDHLPNIYTDRTGLIVYHCDCGRLYQAIYFKGHIFRLRLSWLKILETTIPKVIRERHDYYSIQKCPDINTICIVGFG